jgi:hypothetical protein
VHYRSVVLCAALAALALPGCGGGNNKSAAEKTVKDYLGSLADGDGEQACEKLTGDAKRQAVDYVASNVPELNATSCADALAKLSEQLGGDEASALKDAAVDSSTITGDSATVRMKGASSTAELRKVDGTWYISGGLFQ